MELFSDKAKSCIVIGREEIEVPGDKVTYDDIVRETQKRGITRYNVYHCGNAIGKHQLPLAGTVKIVEYNAPKV